MPLLKLRKGSFPDPRLQEEVGGKEVGSLGLEQPGGVGSRLVGLGLEGLVG